MVSTYVQVSLRVNVKNMIMTQKQSALGTSDVTRRNLANSLEDHARSRYLPPWYKVRAAMVRVKMLFSTSVVVTKVHGYMSDSWGMRLRYGMTMSELAVHCL